MTGQVGGVAVGRERAGAWSWQRAGVARKLREPGCEMLALTPCSRPATRFGRRLNPPGQGLRCIYQSFIRRHLPTFLGQPGKCRSGPLLLIIQSISHMIMGTEVPNKARLQRDGPQIFGMTRMSSEITSKQSKRIFYDGSSDFSSINRF